MELVSNALSYAGTALLVVLLYLLVRGPLSRYFPLFLYTLTYLMTSLAEAWAFRQGGFESALYFDVYWGGELLLDVLLFFVVITLTSRALEGSPLRKSVLRFLALVLVIVLIIPFVAISPPVFGTRWNNRVTELFNFGAAVMTLGLWTALLAGQRRDRQLLTVSAGMGVLLASAAFTMALRHSASSGTALRAVFDWMHRLFFIGGIVIWCRAFWPAGKPKPTAAPTVSAG